MLGYSLPRNRAIEHPADSDAIEIGRRDAEADDPTGVCGELLIFHRNQQFVTHRIRMARGDPRVGCNFTLAAWSALSGCEVADLGTEIATRPVRVFRFCERAARCAVSYCRHAGPFRPLRCVRPLEWQFVSYA